MGGKIGAEADGQTVATAGAKVAIGVTTDGGVSDNMFYVDATGQVKVGPVSIANGHYHSEFGKVEEYKGQSTQTRAADQCDPECH